MPMFFALLCLHLCFAALRLLAINKTLMEGLQKGVLPGSGAGQVWLQPFGRQHGAVRALTTCCCPH